MALILCAVLYVVLMISVVIGLSAHHVFLRRLRLDHHETWVSLGSPSLIFNNSIKNGLAVNRFIWKRRYKDLGDPALLGLGDFIFRFAAVHIILFAAFILVFLFGVRPLWRKSAEPTAARAAMGERPPQ